MCECIWSSHFYYLPVHLERRHDLVKQRRTQFGFHVLDDVFHPSPRPVVVGVHHDAAALAGVLPLLQEPQNVQNVRSQKFGKRVHQMVEVCVLGRVVVVPRRLGQRIAENAQFHKISEGFIHINDHYFFFRGLGHDYVKPLNQNTNQRYIL
jgi:hypothetical protein